MTKPVLEVKQLKKAMVNIMSWRVWILCWKKGISYI